MEGREAPDDIPQRKTRLDVKVVADVNRIVEGDEVEPSDLPINEQDGGEQPS